MFKTVYSEEVVEIKLNAVNNAITPFNKPAPVIAGKIGLNIPEIVSKTLSIMPLLFFSSLTLVTNSLPKITVIYSKTSPTLLPIITWN